VKINQIAGIVYGNGDPGNLDDTQEEENLKCVLMHSCAILKGMMKG